MSRFVFGAILLLVIPSVLSQALGNSNFGPYNIDWTVFETCKGPKQKNCGVFRIEDKRNMSDIFFVIQFPKDCPVDMVRVTIGTKQSGTTKKLWNYSLDHPCQHFVMGPILNESFNLTSNNCKIDKGNYEVHLNMKEKSTKFLGNNFFYGTYDFKVTSYNKFNNFFCVHSILEVMKVPL